VGQHVLRSRRGQPACRGRRTGLAESRVVMSATGSQMRTARQWERRTALLGRHADECELYRPALCLDDHGRSRRPVVLERWHLPSEVASSQPSPNYRSRPRRCRRWVREVEGEEGVVVLARGGRTVVRRQRGRVTSRRRLQLGRRLRRGRRRRPCRLGARAAAKGADERPT
jgi:hypothetical protein